MSEVKLNIVDSERILHGTIHGSIVDSCVAALSAEPKTIFELESALARYLKPTNQTGPFASFCSASEINAEPWDAGSVIIDLASRIVAAESSYSQPGRDGEVSYHDGSKSTDLAVLYRVSDEWMFLNSIDEYQSASGARSQERLKAPLDSRNVLYGRALLEFIVTNVRDSSVCIEGIQKLKLLERARETRLAEAELDAGKDLDESSTDEEDEIGRALHEQVSAIHARWLTTSRVDLEGQSPRDVLLARRDFIDFDMHTRQLQWSFQGEGPPCLSQDTFAYRFAGFGTHECVIYYDLVRLLIWSALDHQSLERTDDSFEFEAEIAWLEQAKNDWLENPQEDLGGRIPAILIENERRRLPITLQAKDMIVDENCDVCLMSARDVEMGYGPAFWHLDGSNMDEGFAFSFCRTQEEWDEENRQREEFDREFNRKWKEREERIARGEKVDDDFGQWIDSLDAEPSASSPDRVDKSNRDDESNLIQ